MTASTPVQTRLTAATAATAAKTSRGRGITIGNGQKSHSAIALTSSYFPGMFDALLPIRRADPSEICACSVKLTQSGDSIIVSEQTRNGLTPARLIAPAEYPYFIDLRLSDGSEIQIEIRRFWPLAGEFLVSEPAGTAPNGALPSGRILLDGIGGVSDEVSDGVSK